VQASISSHSCELVDASCFLGFLECRASVFVLRLRLPEQKNQTSTIKMRLCTSKCNHPLTLNFPR
jgi:hypothetical protein